MTYWDKKLMRELIDNKLAILKKANKHLAGTQGWIKTIREALGMSTEQLAKRVGIHQSRITRLENAEIDGDLKLSSLKKIADGLDMQFVYAFIPRTSLEDMVETQARRIAQKRMDKVNHTMRLENQELSEESKAKALESLTQKVLIENAKDFWD